MKYNLSDICDYAKGKIDVVALDEDTYISTENMMPNKGGITRASSLPTVAQTQVFSAGDVLVSTPYDTSSQVIVVPDDSDIRDEAALKTSGRAIPV